MKSEDREDWLNGPILAGEHQQLLQERVKQLLQERVKQLLQERVSRAYNRIEKPIPRYCVLKCVRA